MKKYRPKTTVEYSYGTFYTARIFCHPQSRWKLLHETGSIVHLINKSVSIDISKDEFKRNWVEVKENKKTETWNGIHAQITAPKGTFDKIWNDTDDRDDI